MVRERGFDAGKLLEEHAAQPASGDDQLLEDALRLIDPKIAAKVETLPSVWHGVQGGSPEARKQVAQKVLKGMVESKQLLIESPVYDMIDASEFSDVLDLHERHFVHVSAEDLGFTKDTPIEKIRAAGEKAGLRLLDPEDAIWLRTAYLSQPEGEYLNVAMGPIEVESKSWLFALSREPNEIPKFEAERGIFGDTYVPGARFIFKVNPPPR